jgi:hypothetical protein
VSTAELKPRGEGSAADSRREFRAFLEEFHERTAAGHGDRRSRTRFPHPWFGPLTARQWIGFLPMHQRIHVRQARAILRALGRELRA